MALGRRFVGYERLEEFLEVIRGRIGPEFDRVAFQKQSRIEPVSSALTG